MQSLPKSDRCLPAARRRRRGPWRASVWRRATLLAWAAVIAAPVLPPWPVAAAVAQRPEVTKNSMGMKLVQMPAGQFEMGSVDTASTLRAAGFYLVDLHDVDWIAEIRSENPIHRVQITKPFLIGQTEVTQAEWRKVMDSSPWKGQQEVKEGADVAATYVSWDDAVEFCGRLTKIERSSGKLRGNRRYRLPTEAEWEYACRAGTKTRFSFGDDEARLGECAWFLGNTARENEKYAHEVGQKMPNPWGLHDTHGNVFEWCSDWYDAKYYRQSPAADPEGPATGSFRVLRGGCWLIYPVFCRSAYRFYGSPSSRNKATGFRVVCELE
jgi:formylglycine-generating enzyme required for sulfatase activity